MRDTKTILEHPRITGHLDFRQPIAALMVAVLHFFSDDDQALGITRAVREALPPGSRLIISHVTVGELSSDTVGQGREVYSSTAAGNVTPRTRDQIAAFFGDLELMEPGLVPTAAWRNENEPVFPAPSGAEFLCGVARVP
jgi:hypothetical protein